MPEHAKRHLLPGWSLLMALMVLLPVLAPGYVLHLDMVFVPHQSLLPWNLGIGGGLPRSVPQDAVVSLLAGPLDGQVLQKAVLLGSLVLAGIGAGRLAGTGISRQLPAASIYVWSAYLAGRLLMGHWGLLWAFALLPWVVLAARRAREQGEWAPVVALCGLSALVPTGGIIAAVTAAPLAVGFASRLRPPSKVLVVGLVVLVNAPWWLAAARSTSAAVSDPLGLVVFGARADGVGGVLLSVLAGGGVWNSQATLASRTTWFAALGTLILVGLAVAGWREWRERIRPEALWLTTLGVVGLLWAWLSGVADDQGWAQQMVSALPGGGLLRDGQKWTLWWVLIVAMCAPIGLSTITRRAEDSLRFFLAAALCALPLAMLPDLAAGGFGRLVPTRYPSDWSVLRDRLDADPAPGDVVTLPWSAFRRYRWNESDVVLDPMPRYLTRTVVWNDDLAVTVGGRVVQVGGDDPRAAVITRTIQSGRPLPPVLAGIGVGWLVVQTDQPAASRAVDFRGATKVWDGDGLQLWRVDQAVRVRDVGDRLLVAVDLIVVLVLGGLCLMWVIGAAKRRRVSDGET